jgi:hypothetical protein
MLAAKRLGVPLDAAKLVYMPPVMPENRAEEPENADEPA